MSLSFTKILFTTMFLFTACKASFDLNQQSMKSEPTNLHSSWSMNQANISVWLSAAAYCNKQDYKTMNLVGPATGVHVESILYDETTDMQGYIATLDTTIYVVFRGSQSMRNWLDDFEIMQVKYPYCEKCQVHKGFYDVVQALKKETIDVVHQMTSGKSSKQFDIIITGHSLGAAIADLMSIELFQADIPTQVYTFGQPRIGNHEFANYVNLVIKDYWRFTHNRDIVPHLPPTEINYYHSCGEIFQSTDSATNLTFCTNVDIDCEDPACSAQYDYFRSVDIKDHMYYLGHYMDCNASISQ